MRVLFGLIIIFMSWVLLAAMLGLTIAIAASVFEAVR